MKVIVQRVTNASCIVDDDVVSAIENGYLLLVGFTHTDTIKDVEYIAKKIAFLRIFEDEDGKLNINIQDKKYAILSISQFTLYGETAKGNRPSFTNAMEPQMANDLYETFNNILKETYHIPTFSGRFGEHMKIMLTNDGPVTIVLESKEQ